MGILPTKKSSLSATRAASRAASRLSSWSTVAEGNEVFKRVDSELGIEQPQRLVLEGLHIRTFLSGGVQGAVGLERWRGILGA